MGVWRAWREPPRVVQRDERGGNDAKAITLLRRAERTLRQP